MARLTARIQRLEALDYVSARDADTNLSEVELTPKSAGVLKS